MNERKPFQGVSQVARYNARFYAAAPLACIALQRLSKNQKLPRALRVLLTCGAASSAWWTLASLLVSHWVYDRSKLYRWQWIKDVLPAPKRWANLHCGLDESTPALRELFPESDGEALDFYDEKTMSEPSIRVARRMESAQKNFVAAPRGDLRALPQGDHCLDCIFLFFSAHEIRDAALRLQFFRELHRVLRRSGRVLLVEHPRDAMNFLAFGPGFFHFHSREEWRRLARESGFQISSEFAVTPFVRVWILEK